MYFLSLQCPIIVDDVQWKTSTSVLHHQCKLSIANVGPQSPNVHCQSSMSVLSHRWPLSIVNVRPQSPMYIVKRKSRHGHANDCAHPYRRQIPSHCTRKGHLGPFQIPRCIPDTHRIMDIVVMLRIIAVSDIIPKGGHPRQSRNQ